SHMPLSYFFNHTPPTHIYTLPYTTLFRSTLVRRGLQGVRPGRQAVARLRQGPVQQGDGPSGAGVRRGRPPRRERRPGDRTERARSEEHTSELQSRGHLVCRLLLEKKKEHK